MTGSERERKGFGREEGGGGNNCLMHSQCIQIGQVEQKMGDKWIMNTTPGI